MEPTSSDGLRICLGSGDRPIEGHVNVDARDDAQGVDVVHDLNAYPWPFESNCADHIVMEHCLEHLDDHCRAMQEIHRILKPGGTARIVVPHFTWQFAWADPTHKHFYAYSTFSRYFAADAGYFDFQFTSCRTRIVFGKTLSVWNYVLSPLFNLFPNVWEQSPLRMFPAVEIQAVLTK